ncbi:MAG: TIM barrel protein [Clostridia bacterium]|nr:TIM barrel protein [Clostridia bacterium]
MAKFILSAFADEASPKVAEQLDALKANKIELIEPRNIDGKNISELTVDEAKQLKAQLDEAGIKVSSIGSYYGKIFINEDFEPHFEAFKNTVEVAKVLGTKYIRMFSFYIPEGENADDYKDEVIRRVKAMAEYSFEKGILCCHENEKGIYGDVPERCFILAEALGE